VTIDAISGIGLFDQVANLLPEVPAAREFRRLLAFYRSGAAQGLRCDQAFGLVEHGCRPWWIVEKSARRAELIWQISQRFFPNKPPARQAAEIAAAIRRYERSEWQRHSDLPVPPAGCPELRRELFWLLKLGLPLGAKTLERQIKQRTTDPRSPVQNNG
jgi:tRNA-dihydrouridine synthase